MNPITAVQQKIRRRLFIKKELNLKLQSIFNNAQWAIDCFDMRSHESNQQNEDEILLNKLKFWSYTYTNLFSF